MKMKLLFKVLVLVFGLLMVYKFREFAGSRSFVETISSMFATPKPANTMNWCVDKVIDVTWVSAEVPEKLKTMDMDDLRDDFCLITTEFIHDVDLSKVVWAPLAESQGPTAQKTTLEWNKELTVFKAGGMPFRSSKLTEILNSKN